MPDMPSLDVSGLLELFALMLSALAVTWGVSKAISIARSF